MASSINFISISKKVDVAVQKGAKQAEIKARIAEKGQEAGVSLSNQLQDELQRHEVTRELLGSPSSSSGLSRFPVGPKGSTYGNLVSFLGLTPDKVLTDINNIQNLMRQFTVDVVAKRDGSGKYELAIRFPKIQEYYNITPPPGGTYSFSWLMAIEKSLLQNFETFLFRETGVGNSRSGTGAQVKNVLRKGVKSIPAYPYITEIYQKVLGDPDNIKSAISGFVKRNFKI